jgi:predicted transcriptional regulator
MTSLTLRIKDDTASKLSRLSALHTLLTGRTYTIQDVIREAIADAVENMPAMEQAAGVNNE